MLLQRINVMMIKIYYTHIKYIFLFYFIFIYYFFKKTTSPALKTLLYQEVVAEISLYNAYIAVIINDDKIHNTTCQLNFQQNRQRKK